MHFTTPSNLGETDNKCKWLQYYNRTDNGSYQCKICSRIFTAQSNCAQHIKNIHFSKGKKIISDNDYEKKRPAYNSIFKFNNDYIQQNIVDILVWKSKHAIPMAALTDKLFAKFALYILPSDKTLQLISNSIAEQIIQIYRNRFKNRYISITIDAGTVLNLKWLAVGAIYSDGNIKEFNLLDVYVCEGPMTSEYLKEHIQKLKAELEQKNCLIVGVCSDNAANFVSCFDEYVDDLRIFRFACSCHTIQLAIKDFFHSIEIFKDIKKFLKTISNKLSYTKKSTFEKYGLGVFPKYQRQRWNSVFISLQYINNNFEKIKQLLLSEKHFSQNELLTLNLYSIQFLCSILQPIYDFTTMVEGDTVNIAQMFKYYRLMIKKLKEIQQETEEEYCSILINIIEKRFHTTLQLEYAELAYFFTYEGVKEFQDQYKNISLITHADPIEDHKRKLMLIEQTEHLQKLKNSLSKIFDIWFPESYLKQKILLLASFEKMLLQFEIDDKKSSSPDPIDYFHLKKLLTDIEAIDISDFAKKLWIIPASEATAERIFAKMRDLYNTVQTRMSPETLRSNLILFRYSKEMLYTERNLFEY